MSVKVKANSDIKVQHPGIQCVLLYTDTSVHQLLLLKARRTALFVVTEEKTKKLDRAEDRNDTCVLVAKLGATSFASLTSFIRPTRVLVGKEK